MPVAALFDTATPPAMRTINHLGNEPFTLVEARLCHALNLAPLRAGPDVPLLDSVHAPIVNGTDIDPEFVAQRQLTWYRGRPDIVDTILARTTRLRDHLGLRLPRFGTPPRDPSCPLPAAGLTRPTRATPAQGRCRGDRLVRA